jgi:hypothetical protein
MPRINPEQLESEADELLKTMATPPDEPDTGKPKQEGEKPEDELEPEPEEGAGEGDPKDEPKPGDNLNEPPAPADTGEDGLTLDNARERIRNAQARMHKATQEAADLRKKVASQDVELSALRASVSGFEQQIETLKQQPPAKPDTESDDVSDAELQAIAEEYPSIAKPFIKVINSLNKQLKIVGDKVATVEGTVNKTVSSIQQDDENSKMEAHFAAIREAHPDAFKLYESDDFKGWLDRQPPAFALIMKQGSADDVIYVFDQYKKAVGTIEDEEQPNKGGQDKLAKARAAATPSVRQVRTDPTKKPTKPTFTRKQIADMSPEEFEEREAEIDEAIADGRITA